MKYVAPEMEIVAIGVDAAIAADADYEIGVDMSAMLSKNSMPN